jgi:hypothetical protein
MTKDEAGKTFNIELQLNGGKYTTNRLRPAHREQGPWFAPLPADSRTAFM